MEEVDGRDSDGVGGPKIEAWIVFVDVEYEGGTVPEMGTYGGWISIAVSGSMYVKWCLIQSQVGSSERES